MPYLHDDVLDDGLQVLVDATSTILTICSALPTTRTEAVTTYALGSKSSPSITGPADRAGGGREVTIAAITDGSVDATGTAAYWALSDGTRLLAANDLASSQAVTNGNTWELDAQKIGIPDPA